MRFANRLKLSSVLFVWTEERTEVFGSERGVGVLALGSAVGLDSADFTVTTGDFGLASDTGRPGGRD